MPSENGRGMRPIPREEILRRFERWLDETLASETPPSGAAAEILAELEGGETAKANRFDLHALWSALTVVSQETKLQGRSFKKLDDTLAPWIPWIEDMQRRDDAWIREVELGARRRRFSFSSSCAIGCIAPSKRPSRGREKKLIVD